MSKEKQDIRNIDDDLYRRARTDAISRGYKNIGQWLNEAIAMKLALSGMKFYIDEQGCPTIEDSQGSKATLRGGKWELGRQA